MDLNEYQRCALKTAQTPKSAVSPEIVPLLGLAGEAGELLSEYKKYLRDGASHRLFKARVAEELGDLLWYIAAVASHFDLDLDIVAQENLRKCAERWGGNVVSQPYIFDADFPPLERLPRHIRVHFTTVDVAGAVKLRAFVDGKQLGNDLTDNAYADDGYRFHDIFHLSCAAVLGWSPVARKILSRKRKSNLRVDEVEDGGRAGVIEEGISVLVFSYAKDHADLDGIASVDYRLLRTIKGMTDHLEVAVCTPRDWEQAILAAYSVWREVEQNGGGTVDVNLDSRELRLLPARVQT